MPQMRTKNNTGLWRTTQDSDHLCVIAFSVHSISAWLDVTFYVPQAIVWDIGSELVSGSPDLSTDCTRKGLDKTSECLIAHAGMPMHLVNCMGTAGDPDERFIDVFRGGQLLTRCLHSLP